MAKSKKGKGDARRSKKNNGRAGSHATASKSAEITVVHANGDVQALGSQLKNIFREIEAFADNVMHKGTNRRGSRFEIAFTNWLRSEHDEGVVKLLARNLFGTDVVTTSGRSVDIFQKLSKMPNWRQHLLAALVWSWIETSFQLADGEEGLLDLVELETVRIFDDEEEEALTDESNVESEANNPKQISQPKTSGKYRERDLNELFRKIKDNLSYWVRTDEADRRSIMSKIVEPALRLSIELAHTGTSSLVRPGNLSSSAIQKMEKASYEFRDMNGDLAFTRPGEEWDDELQVVACLFPGLRILERPDQDTSTSGQEGVVATDGVTPQQVVNPLFIATKGSDWENLRARWDSEHPSGRKVTVHIDSI